MRAALISAAAALALTASAPAERIAVGPTCGPASPPGADVGSFARISTCAPYFAGRYTYLPASFRVVSGALPPGLTLWGSDERAAQLTDTPTRAGTYTFRIAATDARGGAASRSYTLTIHRRLVLPSGHLGKSEDGRFFVAARGGAPPYAYSLDRHVAGISLGVGKSSGTMSGDVPGIFGCPFPMRVTDSTGATAVGYFQIPGEHELVSCIAIAPDRPRIAHFNPDSVTVGQRSGTAFAMVRPVTLTGSDLGDVTAVSFGGSPAVFTVDSPTKITAYPPLGVRHGGIAITSSAGTRGVGVVRVLAP